MDEMMDVISRAFDAGVKFVKIIGWGRDAGGNLFGVEIGRVDPSETGLKFSHATDSGQECDLSVFSKTTTE